MVISEGVVTGLIFGFAACGLIFAIIQRFIVASIDLDKEAQAAEDFSNRNRKLDQEAGLIANEGGRLVVNIAELKQIAGYISEGANAFLFAEYKILAVFIVIFGALVFVLVGSAGNCGPETYSNIHNVANISCKIEHFNNHQLVPGCGWQKNDGLCWTRSAYTTLSFVLGGITSIISGFIGMRIAVYANVRTSVMCITSWTRGFNTAFRAGSVMGFSLVSIGLAVLYITILAFNAAFKFDDANVHGAAEILFECITGYGLGGSSIALFGRVGGGIYTKAADVGADLVGKVEAGIPEDDPRNPAVIADNVGDNVGDVAGMGADLFGSFAEATCACLVIASVSPDLNNNWTYLMFPLLITAFGIMGCLITSFFATDIPFLQVNADTHVERNLKIQLLVSTIIMTALIYVLTVIALPDTQFCTQVLQEVTVNNICGVNQPCLCGKYTSSLQAFGCIAAGLWSGMIIGFWTEYMTSYSYTPVKDIANASQFGAGPNIIYGLAAGYKSVIIPTFCLAITIFVAFFFADMYGISLAALGMLSTLSTGLTIDAYGPITDNAGGIAEMAGLPKAAREKTDVLDAAGNTTAAIGKGFAIGSAALVSLALFGAFVTRAQISGVNILEPLTFAGLLVGAMLPFWFSALTVRSVGDAATEMVAEVRRQFEDGQILLGNRKADYSRCVRISTQASLRQMIAPGALVMLSPIIAGCFFGVKAVTGLLAGGLVAGVQVAISSSNSGGAWDNAKKLIEKDGGKGSDQHKAAVVGDTVGDPLKDTSGPSLNILMKLMAIISLVFAPFFVQHSLYKGN